MKLKSLSCIQLFATPWTTKSMEFSWPEYWSGQPFPSPGDLPNLGIEPNSPTLQVDSLPAEPQGKPKNTGVGSLSLLQWIFPTHELNWGLLHCRWTLYQLSYNKTMMFFKIQIPIVATTSPVGLGEESAKHLLVILIHLGAQWFKILHLETQN